MKKIKRCVRVGSVTIGGAHPVVVQSMTNTKTHDAKRTIAQIKRLEKAGCEMVRVAVVDRRDADAIRIIKKSVSIPVIADIHFDHRLALRAIDAGIDKVRINPGTMSDRRKLREIIRYARDKGVPMRIGINSGSLPGTILARHRHPTRAALVRTVERVLQVFDRQGFRDIVLSAKGANVNDTVEVYRTLHRRYSFPLHIGITEAGMPFRGSIRSAVGIGILLAEGIGDTVRVSLTGDPVMEVMAAYEILLSLGLRKEGPLFISCPTCGRCDVDLAKMARKVEKRLQKYRRFMKVAVMGCVVNGPGEAREADFGIACGRSTGIVFKRGREVRRVREAQLVDALFEVIDANTSH